MKVKFSFVPEDILVQNGHGELVAELTAAELKEFTDAEQKYFELQYEMKKKAKMPSGMRYFSDGRD